MENQREQIIEKTLQEINKIIAVTQSNITTQQTLIKKCLEILWLQAYNLGLEYLHNVTSTTLTDLKVHRERKARG